MTSIWRKWCLAVGLCSAWGVGVNAQTPQEGSSAAAGRVIVKFKSGVPYADLSAVARASASATGNATSGVSAAPRRAHALAVRTAMALSDGRAIDAHTQVIHARGVSSQQLAARLARDPQVDSVTIDYRRYLLAAPNDPRYGLSTSSPLNGQWYLRAPAGPVRASVNAEGGWSRSTGAGVRVAILDTGVRFSHPDLAGKLLPGYDFVSTTPVSNDGTGVDAVPSDPGDWVDITDISANPSWQNGNCVIEDSSWHGTQTAGLVGASTNNGIGIAGLGGDVKILPVRVLGKCGGFDSDIIAGLQWAAGIHVDGVPDNPTPAKIINLSLGSADSCSSLYQQKIAAVRAAGAMVISAAGNDAYVVNTPANCPGVVAVGAVAHDGLKAFYSNLGSGVTLSAPGGDCTTSPACDYPLTTTTDSGTKSPVASTYTSGGANATLGTSFAAPLVAGAAALVWSASPLLTADQVVNVLKNTARAFPTTGGPGGTPTCTAPTSGIQEDCYCTTGTCGAGMLDVKAAVESVAAARVMPVISFDASTANPGSVFAASSSLSELPAGRTVQSRLWSIFSGSEFAQINAGATNGTVNLQGLGFGPVVLRLSITDNTNTVTTRDTTIQVGGPPAEPGEANSGGGGALGTIWLTGLALGVFALIWVAPVRRRQCPTSFPGAAGSTRAGSD